MGGERKVIDTQHKRGDLGILIFGRKQHEFGHVFGCIFKVDSGRIEFQSYLLSLVQDQDPAVRF